MKLEQFCRQAFDLARRLKLDDIELLLTESRSLGARLENHDLNLDLEEGIFTCGCRVLKGGRLGHVPLGEPDVATLAIGIRQALTKAGPAPFPSFAAIARPRTDLETWDPKVAALIERPARLRDLGRDLAARAYTEKGVENLEGGFGVGVEERMVATLSGSAPAHARRTNFLAMAEVNSKDFDFVASRRLPDFERVAALGAGVARSLPRQTSTPEAEKVKGRSIPVIIHPVMLEGILRNLVGEQLFASTARQGLSRLTVGERCAVEGFTLHDDATAPWSDSTFPTDDEGTPSRRTTVIERGVLKTWLYDRAAAAEDGVESTGNGRRRKVLIESPHEAPVRASVNDIFVEPGATPLAKMVGSIKAGVVVKYLLGFHTANRTTGDFTNTLYLGRVIRNGREVALPEPGRWAMKGNALDLLGSITAISRETLAVGSGVLPWVQAELAVA